MILTCPNCETQYFADDSTIGESGRTVKCAACGHSWFVAPPGLEAEKARVAMDAIAEYSRKRKLINPIHAFRVNVEEFI